MKTRHLLLGLDIGTTEIKGAVFDARSGRLVTKASRRLPLSQGGDGAREQDPLDVLAALRGISSALSRAAGADWGRIDGIGLAAQGGSAILADSRTGRAHTRMQLWNDFRPYAELPAIAALKPESWWRDLSRLPGPGAGLGRLMWLRKRHPGLFKKPDALVYCGAGEFCFFHLTGVWRQDAGNAIQIGCYSVGSQSLDEAPLRLIGIPLGLVAPLRLGHERHALSAGGARLLGLREGIPVAGPYMDHEAGYLSAAGHGEGALQCSLGTAWVGNFVTRRPPAAADGLDLQIPSPISQGSLVLRVMRAGNASWDWATAGLLGGAGRLRLTRAEAVFRAGLLPPDGLTALPWLTLPNPLDAGATGAGAFFGVGTQTSREDLVRAMAAGMCFEFARLFDPLKRSGVIDRVVLGGGAANGFMFRQLLAALFAPLPVFLPADQDTAGARGVLHAFLDRHAHGASLRVRLPSAWELAGIRRQAELYERVRAAYRA